MNYEVDNDEKIFSNEGERPKLNSQVQITGEMTEMFEKTKTNIVNKRFAGAFGTAAVLVLCLVRFKGVLFMVQLGIAAVLGLISLALYLRYKKISDGENTETQYIENCIVPIANQIVPGVTVEQTLHYMPLYGPVENEKFGLRKGENVIELAMVSARAERNLGNYLVEHCVIPEFKTSFETDFVIDALTNNKEGFFFTNAKATTETQSENSRSIHIEFEGPIVAMRMKHAVRSGVSMYTSKKGMFGKEGANGYRKVNTVDTENDEFNSSFEVSAEEESQAFFVLSPLVMENLLKMKEQYGNFGLYIEDDFLIFGFDLRRQPLRMPESYSAAKKMDINKTVDEIVKMLNMIYDFKDAVDLNFDTTMQ